MTLEEAQAAEAEAAAQLKRRKRKRNVKTENEEAGKEEKVKKLKKKKRKKLEGSEVEADPDVVGPSSSSMPDVTSIRPPAFIVDAVAEALKPAFANHLVITYCSFRHLANLNG
jgi:hypothetical protein